MLGVEHDGGVDAVGIVGGGLETDHVGLGEVPLDLIGLPIIVPNGEPLIRECSDDELIPVLVIIHGYKYTLHARKRSPKRVLTPR